MNEFPKEMDPVFYNSAAIKIHHFMADHHNQECFRMHWHERMEFLRINEGSMLVDFATAKEEMQAGTFVIIHPNQPHRGTAVKTPLRYDVLMFDIRSFYNQTEICHELFPSIYDGRTRFLNSTSNPEVLDCARQIVAEPQFEQEPLLMTSNVYRLIYLLYKHCLTVVLDDTPFDRNMKEIIKYIETNYTSNLSTEQLCAVFKYAKPYFCRKFKESTGLTPMQYIKIYRLEKAYALLKEGRSDIGEVAMLTGFPDSNYFTRCFKAHFGHPPTFYISGKG